MGILMRHVACSTTGGAMNHLSPWHHEPSLEEILSDAITVAVMRADGVDPAKLAAKLRRFAAGASDAIPS
jgi:hypothetical protein